MFFTQHTVSCKPYKLSAVRAIISMKMKRPFLVFLAFTIFASLAYSKEVEPEHLFDYNGKSYCAVSKKKFLSREKWALQVDGKVVTPFKYLSIEGLGGGNGQYFIVARTKGKKKLEYHSGEFSVIGASCWPYFDYEWDWYYDEFVAIGIDDYSESEPIVPGSNHYNVVRYEEDALIFSDYYREKLKPYFHLSSDYSGEKENKACFLFVIGKNRFRCLLDSNARNLFPDYNIKDDWTGPAILAERREGNGYFIGKKVGLVLPDGEVLLDFEYDSIRERGYGKAFENGKFIFARKDGREGIFLPKQSEQSEGHFISPFKYEEIKDFLQFGERCYAVVQDTQSSDDYAEKLVILNDDSSKEDEIVLSDVRHVRLTKSSEEFKKLSGKDDIHWILAQKGKYESRNEMTALYRLTQKSKAPELILDYVDGDIDRSINIPFYWMGNYYCVVQHKGVGYSLVLLGNSPKESRVLIPQMKERPSIYPPTDERNEDLIITISATDTMYAISKKPHVTKLLSDRKHDILYFRYKAPYYYIYDFPSKYYRLNPDGEDEKITENEWNQLPEEY